MTILPFEKVWKPLKYPNVKYDKYEVSNIGEVRYEHSKVIISPYVSTNGNIYIALENITGIMQMFMLSNIIACSFDIIPDESLVDKTMKIRFKNDDPTDIRPDNVEWIEDLEEWQDLSVLGFNPNLWKISSHGNIYGCRYKKMLKLRIAWKSSKYLRIGGLAKGDIHGIELPVHRLVASAFVSNPDPDNYVFVNHIDGNPLNNHYLNLEWVSPSLNNKHAVYLGLVDFAKGERSSSAKLTEDMVRNICSLLIKYDGKINDVSRETNVNSYAIRAIRNGISWKDISTEYFDNRYFIHKTPTISNDDSILVQNTLKANDMNVNRTLQILSNIRNITKSQIAYIKRKMMNKI